MKFIIELEHVDLNVCDFDATASRYSILKHHTEQGFFFFLKKNNNLSCKFSEEWPQQGQFSKCKIMHLWLSNSK